MSWTSASLPGSVRYFQAVAIDFDGTLSDGGTVPCSLLQLLLELREAGLRVVLVTGRILSELRSHFADVDHYVDMVVAENGAVLATRDGSSLLSQPTDPRLDIALAHASVTFRRGQVLVACSGVEELTVLGAIRSLGLDCQLIRNRSELMILPAGVNKATGLLVALDGLGISPHNAVAIGDGENDGPMLACCELGVAVANAVESLKSRADIVLEQPSSHGVEQFLRSSLENGFPLPRPSRFEAVLGTDANGAEVRLPASRLNMAIVGASGEGKSYLAGLIAEQLIGLQYSLLVVDPEGDFLGLANLPGVVIIGGVAGLPTPSFVAALFTSRVMSLVVDLSAEPVEARVPYVAALRIAINAIRKKIGRPHWVIVDEAQDVIASDELDAEHPVAPSWLSMDNTGHCLVTWKPEEFSADLPATIDVAVVLGGANPMRSAIGVAAVTAGVGEGQVASALPQGDGTALLVTRDSEVPLRPFTLGVRRTAHLRHDHKYQLEGVGEGRQFVVRDVSQLFAAVGNLDELVSELQTSPASALLHHCANRDISRWIRDVFRDQRLARSVAAIEARAVDGIIDVIRRDLIGALVAKQRRNPAGMTSESSTLTA
jgi:hypothetical protein